MRLVKRRRRGLITVLKCSCESIHRWFVDFFFFLSAVYVCVCVCLVCTSMGSGSLVFACGLAYGLVLACGGRGGGEAPDVMLPTLMRACVCFIPLFMLLIGGRCDR